MKLSELERDAELNVPIDVGRAIKAWHAGTANDQQQRLAYQFVVEALSGVNRMSYLPGIPDATHFMTWREGRRFVGSQLARIVAEQIPDEQPPVQLPQRRTRRAA